MKKIFLSVVIIFVFLFFFNFFKNANINNKSAEKFYNINSNFNQNYITQQNFKKNKNTLFSSDTVFCSVDDNLQSKINESVGKTLILNEGIHKSYMLKIPSNIKIVIPTNTTIKLANDLILDQSMYPDAVGDAVIKCVGSEHKYLENIFIKLDGIIDGNKSVHPYSKGGVEGIDFKWAKNIFVYGKGSIVNVNGDGLDIDVSNNIYVEGINFLNNDGAGIHFGSPRPIKSSFNNLIIGCSSNSNGFDRKRAGFDQSWPNINAVTYYNCNSTNNYQNWDIKGSGVLILNPFSKYDLSFEKSDYFDDALFHSYNNEYKSDLVNLKEFKIEKSGYYLLSNIKYHNLNNSEITINGKKLNGIDLISQNSEYKMSTGIYFFQKNDVIKLNHLKPRFNDNSYIKLNLILTSEDIYHLNYDFKILVWKLKSEFYSVIGDIYSFVFD